MANPIIKKASATVVKYSTVEFVDGAPVLVSQPDAVFRGILSAERAKKALAKQLDTDTQFVVVSVESGEKRYAMSFEDFVRNAYVIDENGNLAEEASEETADTEDEVETANEEDTADVC